MPMHCHGENFDCLEESKLTIKRFASLFFWARKHGLTCVAFQNFGH
jgi:hypothetical protein